MLIERDSENSYLGQFIPVHYHHNMLMDQNRMANFKAAIDYAVFPGAKVLELGGGTGVLSWFAAAHAEKVWCVEFNPDMVREARRLLSRKNNARNIEVVHADAFEFLPPEPVDFVICEMIHVAMLREKQVEVIESFKQRYLQRFGGPLPVFIPEAVLMAVQPLQEHYDFHGFNAPIVQFRQAHTSAPETIELAEPVVYSMLDFTQPTGLDIRWEGEFRIRQEGTVNALRFITNNVLAVVPERANTIAWLNDYMALPLAEPVHVSPKDLLRVGFHYRAGGSIPSLQATLSANVARPPAIRESHERRLPFGPRRANPKREHEARL